MAFSIFNTSTLSEQITDSTKKFTVGSTTNISVGDLLKIRNELVKVQEIPSSGTVHVSRGFSGTEARTHASGQRFFILANPHDAGVNSKKQLSIISATGVYPDYLFPGQEATDGDGNHYVLCELSATVYGGSTVVISKDGNYTAAVVTSSDQGPVGVTVEYGTSDQYVWVLRRGYYAVAQETIASSNGTSAQLACVATTASTPSVGLAATTIPAFSSVAGQAQTVIHGMWIVGVASTATTSAASATGVAYPVFLDYPYVNTFQTQTAVTS